MTIQWAKSSADSSVTTSATSTVSAGGVVQVSSGTLSAPVHVYSTGISPPVAHGPANATPSSARSASPSDSANVSAGSDASAASPDVSGASEPSGSEPSTESSTDVGDRLDHRGGSRRWQGHGRNRAGGRRRRRCRVLEHPLLVGARRPHGAAVVRVAGSQGRGRGKRHPEREEPAVSTSSHGA